MGGDFSRTFTGSRFSDERYDKRVWSGRTIPVTEPAAEAIKGAVRGLGHVFPCNDDAYSTKGLGPSGEATRIPGTADDGNGIVDENGISESKFGSHSLANQGATTNILAADQRDVEGVISGSFTAIDSATLQLNGSLYVQGSQSMRVVTSATVNGVRGGAETDPVACSGAAQYFGSLFVYSNSASQVRVYLEDDTGLQGTPKTITLTAQSWTWITTNSLLTDGAATTIKLVMLEDTADSAIDVYCDGFQIEEGSSATYWVDGSRSAEDASYNATWIRRAMGGLTFNAWVKGPASANGTQYLAYIAENVSAHNTFYVYRTSSNSFRFVIGGDGGAGTGSLIYNGGFDGDWHMVTAVVRTSPESGENTREIYWDGVLVTSTDTDTTGLPDFTKAAIFNLGQSGSSSLFNHETRLDDPMVVPYAAPSEQIAAWYNMGKAMSGLSRVYVDGDVMPDEALTVLAEGDARTSKYIAAYKGGAFRSNLRKVDVELWEV